MINKKTAKKILIVIPDLKVVGGVSTIFRSLEMEKEANCEYFQLKYHSTIPFLRFLELLIFYGLFFIKCQKYKVIHLNPSFCRNAFFREMAFLFLAKIMLCKTVVYWHGWQVDFERAIINNRFLKYLFKKTYGQANLNIVLGSLFERKLRDIGFKKNIIIETNCFDDSFVKQNNVLNVKNISSPVQLLFLSRLEERKGIFIAIDSIAILNEMGYFCELTIAGTSNEIYKIKNYVVQKNIHGVFFTGEVTGKNKHELLKTSHILLFPTYYPEGLPLVILEGMAYGLPIISRPVGGISDVVINEENGYLTDSLDPNDYVKFITKLISSNELYVRISNNNIIKAQETFLPGELKKRLLNIYANI